MAAPSDMLLCAELAAEKQKTARLQAEVDKLRCTQVQMQRVLEQEEEAITNKVFRSLDVMKAEKEQLARSVEEEEELITNTLQKKLEQLRKEKVDLQSQLECEEEYIVNKLQAKQLQLQQQLASSAGASTSSNPSTPRETVEMRKKVESYETAIVQLKAKLMTMDKRCRDVVDQNTKLENEVASLRKENFKLHWILANPHSAAAAQLPPPLLPPDPQPSSPNALAPNPLSQSLGLPITTAPSLLSQTTTMTFSHYRHTSSSSSATTAGGATAAAATEGRVRAASDADVVRQETPKMHLQGVLLDKSGNNKWVAVKMGPQDKVLLEGKVCTKLEGAEQQLVECQFAVFSNGCLRMHTAAHCDISIEIRTLVGITEVNPQTIKIKCKKDNSPARLLAFPTPEDCQICASLLRDLVSSLSH